MELPPERPGRPVPLDLVVRRRQMQAAVDGGMWTTAKPPVEATLAGLRCLRFAPDAAPLKALRGEIGEAPLIVGGDSAGGGLAASLGLLAAAHGGLQVDALVLLSPWLDLTVSAPSYVANAATDPMFSTESASVAAELYLQGFDPRHPLASPLFAPLHGLPPTFLSVGTGEVLRDDSQYFYEKLLATGISASLCAVDGMEHVAVVRGMDLPGAAETFAAIARFVNGILAIRGV